MSSHISLSSAPSRHYNVNALKRAFADCSSVSLSLLHSGGLGFVALSTCRRVCGWSWGWESWVSGVGWEVSWLLRPSPGIQLEAANARKGSPVVLEVYRLSWDGCVG